MLQQLHSPLIIDNLPCLHLWYKSLSLLDTGVLNLSISYAGGVAHVYSL